MRHAIAMAMVALIGLGLSAPAPAQTPFRPVATVNNAIITAYDVDQRARLLSAMGAGEDDPQQLARLALDRLIEDRLKMQQGAQAGIRPTPEIVQRAIAEFAGSVQSTPEELRAELSGAGINGQALEDMVVAQVIWREVVNTRFRGRIDPAEVEIDAEIDLASQNRNVSYRLQEIGLPTAENNRGEAATLALAERLVAELSAGGDFAAAARQYSRAPSARSGGVVGWVPAASLPPEMARDLAALEPGQISRPMPVQGGITILRLIEERSEDTNAVEADAALREQVRQGLVNQRLELLSQGLLQELRRDALIQLR